LFCGRLPGSAKRRALGTSVIHLMKTAHFTGNPPYSFSPYSSVWRGAVDQSGASGQLAAAAWCVLACDVMVWL